MAKAAGSKKWRATVGSLGALAAGIAVGSALRSSHPGWVLGLLAGAGTIWVNALRMIALPLAISNMLCAMVRERSGQAAGRIGGAVGIYVVLLLMGAGIVFVFLPPMMHATAVDHGAIAALSQGASGQAKKVSGAVHSAPAQGLGEMIVGLMPRNLVESAVNEDFLRLLIFAILFGLALRRASPENGGVVIRFIEGVTEALMILVRWLIWCSPAAMFALAATFAASSGARIVGVLGRFVVFECVLMLGFVALLYPLTMVFGGLSLRRFAAAALGPQMVAVSTRSSIAALPALLDAGDKMTPENPETSRTLLPLAVGIFKVNRTTSALCRLLVILYFWSIPAAPAQVLTFLATVMLLSFSELGLPGGTQYRTVPAYLAAGCPIEAVVLLEVLEPFSDICKTLLNVTGDLSIAAVVTRWSERPAPERVMVAAGSRVS